MEDIKVATTIVEAEVYRSGCTIVRRGTVALPAGTSHLVVEDLPRDLDEGSISLRMPAGVTQSQVRVVREGLFYGGAIVSPTEELNKQIKELDRRIENLELELEAWKDLARKMSGPAAIDFLERLPAKLDELSSTHARLTEERNKLSRERDKPAPAPGGGSKRGRGGKPPLGAALPVCQCRVDAVLRRVGGRAQRAAASAHAGYGLAADG